MSLTDERIRELGDTWLALPGHWGEINGIVEFARAIEAEAKKPCVCGDSSEQGVFHRNDGPCYIAVEEATKPKEPVGEVKLHTGSLGDMAVIVWTGEQPPVGTKLYTTPQRCPKCAEGMVSVTKEDANNYCRILSMLGMEEEGSPVSGIERLIMLRDGMVCGDCNDTGWLENREEGRYPCTCMTEAEPYQILEAKCAELEAKVEQLKMVPMKYRRMEFNAQLQRENMELRVERDALAAQLNRVRRALDAEP